MWSSAFTPSSPATGSGIRKPTPAAASPRQRPSGAGGSDSVAVAGASANNISAMSSTVRWRSDFDKLVVTSNCERRGWQRWVPGEGEDWNFFWANVHTVKQIFNPDNGFRMGEHQMVHRPPSLNALPSHYWRGKAKDSSVSVVTNIHSLTSHSHAPSPSRSLHLTALHPWSLCQRPRSQ